MMGKPYFIFEIHFQILKIKTIYKMVSLDNFLSWFIGYPADFAFCETLLSLNYIFIICYCNIIYNKNIY